MYQWLEMFRHEWNKYGQPGSQVNLNSDLVKNQKIAIPSKEEQQKIGTLFKQLDSSITLHQRRYKLVIFTHVSHPHVVIISYLSPTKNA